ncbi:MAG: site-2 protease family protein [Acidobacteria bacterium]|nr:site-2 protease family protein [Acidobacteriota bacterium]
MPRTIVPVPGPDDRVWLHVLLLAATFVTTTLVGALHYRGFAFDPSGSPPLPPWGRSLFGGLWYSVSILAILGAHEMGHYLACRYHRVAASLPYFLPVPLPLTGTIGAFIRIRQPIRTKAQLFDIGVAGPIAGFVVLLPLMVAGVMMSRVVPVPPEADYFGEPLILQALIWLVHGPRPEGYDLVLHPMGFAAWFGLLATALNLFPIGQLDGGHISYAVVGRRSIWVTYGAVGMALALATHSMSWIAWTILIVVMLFIFGPRHPSTMDEHVPLDRTRLAVALLAALIFVACFTPAPIQPYELIRPR